MQSDRINKLGKAIQETIDHGNIDIEDLYVEFVQEMQTFLTKLEEYSVKKRSNYIIKFFI